MVKVLCAFLRCTRLEYERILNDGFIDGLTYDKTFYFSNVAAANAFAENYRNSGNYQYEKGDSIIDIVVCDLYDEYDNLI